MNSNLKRKDTTTSNNSNSSKKKVKKTASYFRQHIVPNPPKVDYSKTITLPEGSNIKLTDVHKEQLRTDGYCVVDNVIQEYKVYEEKFWDWLENLGTGIQRRNWSTWTKDHAPIQTRGIIEYPSLVHAEFIWEIRCHPNIRSLFAQLWNDSDLLVGFCRARIIPPALVQSDEKEKTWFHVDQSSRRRGLHCIQGVLNLTDSSEETDAGLVLIPGSHHYHNEYFKEHDIAVSREWYKHTEEDLKWFYETKQLKSIKVNAKAGSVILWDSRTIHCNKKPSPNQVDQTKAGIGVYICMTPRKWCDNEILLKKQKAFNQVAFASHWPHIVQYIQENKPPFRTNGIDCTKFKNIQTTPPLLDDIGLRLAGF